MTTNSKYRFRGFHPGHREQVYGLKILYKKCLPHLWLSHFLYFPPHSFDIRYWTILSIPLRLRGEYTHTHSQFERQTLFMRTANRVCSSLFFMRFSHLFRFEQLNKITRRIDKQYLGSARPRHNIVPKMEPLCFQFFNLR